MPKLAEIMVPMIPDAHYTVNHPWSYLREFIERQKQEFNIDLDPDFQRGHVWTPEQRVAYIEFRLRGGRGSEEIKWNADTWTWRREKGCDLPQNTLILVDGKQRLTAVLDFMEDKFPVFCGRGEGFLASDITDLKNRWTSLDFVFRINNLQKRADLLQWYLELNAGGTPHAPEEIERVRQLLAAEKSK